MPRSEDAASAEAATPAAAVLPTRSPLDNSTRPTEVVGVAAVAHRAPGAALQPEGFADVVSLVPADRWDVELQLTEDPPARFGGFISGVQVGLAGQLGG